MTAAEADELTKKSMYTIAMAHIFKAIEEAAKKGDRVWRTTDGVDKKEHIEHLKELGYKVEEKEMEVFNNKYMTYFVRW